MSTYQELLNQKAALDQQIAVARKAQAKQALAMVHDLITKVALLSVLDRSIGDPCR